MKEFELTVRRGALLMWGLAVAGVPFIIFGVDILFQRRLATTITDLIYPSDNVTPPPFETHELLWAWVFLGVGAAMTGWALKELIAPRRIIQADTRGLSLAVAGPFASAVRLPWTALTDFESSIDEDQGGSFDVLRIHVSEPERLPTRPWGARWSKEGVLSLAAGEWDVDAGVAAERLGELAVFHLTQPEVVAAEQDGETWTHVVPSAPTPLPASLADTPWGRSDAEIAEEIMDSDEGEDAEEGEHSEELSDSDNADESDAHEASKIVDDSGDGPDLIDMGPFDDGEDAEE